MGWWQGRLLRDAIRDLHPAWHRAALGDGERGETLRSACRVYVDQVRRRLPEAIRQEVDGLAAGSGVDADTLLLTEVMRDGLRFHPPQEDEAPRLGGLLAVEQGEPPTLLLAPTGPDAAMLLERGIVVERHPAEGRATILVAWPGSLGGVAGYAASGHAVLAAEVAVPLARQSLREAPFSLRLRLALERADTVSDLVDRLGGATASRVLVAHGPDRAVRLALTGIAATETADLGAVPSFVLPPEGRAGDVVVPARPRPLPEPRPAGWRLTWGGETWHVERAP